MTGLTPYARFGDKLALALLGVVLIASIGSGRRSRRS
jgi:apolipoprotein N-acyltransferase